jgi:hypothetical protein
VVEAATCGILAKHLATNKAYARSNGMENGFYKKYLLKT